MFIGQLPDAIAEQRAPRTSARGVDEQQREQQAEVDDGVTKGLHRVAVVLAPPQHQRVVDETDTEQQSADETGARHGRVDDATPGAEAFVEGLKKNIPVLLAQTGDAQDSVDS